ncbi:integrase [Viridibacillus sp. FSL H7-0596]|uniref:tyrosine-type recombinase/integrase n=1 Tax=Viridibacillus sp. FSL H7-0596 TaxID=1928923 RepID=UPI00096E0BB4|nr:tyrosine-type recombinase/integrase [Viridibacillus sp. FSL H7-0596]OMC89225.1 integrase [Viridibacillus sp. FSL H7-0596]
MNALIKAFEKWLIEDGKAMKTIESYINDVNGYEAYRKDKTKEETIMTRFLFVRYKQHLESNGFAISTINKKINSLKVYNDFLVKNQLVDGVFINLKRDCSKIAKGSEHIVTVLNDEEVEKFLFYLESNKVLQRNKVIGYLLLYTGVRVSELVGIQLENIDLLTNTLRIFGKGGKIREVPLRKDVLTLIQHYRKEERAQSKFVDSPYLLVSQRSLKMHQDGIRNWLGKVSREIGLHLHPHLFRHTFATRLLNNGVDIATVSKLCGHASINMTMQFYINVSQQRKKAAVEKL